MYAKSLHIYDFKCFGKADLQLQYPGRSTGKTSEIENVNLILGDNGGGKSSVLRALAISVLAPALMESGFVPYRLVRRAKPGDAPVKIASLKVEGETEKNERTPETIRRKKLELTAQLETRGSGSLDRLNLDQIPNSPVAEVLYDEFSSAFFMVGYGATRRVETGEFSESSARKSRGPRYQRVAGLFEDHVTLRPLQAWLPRIERRSPKLFEQVIELLNSILPQNIRFYGKFDEVDGQYIFDFEGSPTPLSALSDGYKAFIGWVGDLIGHAADVLAGKTLLANISGIVLVDEIDLHLHPEWQRHVIPSLANAFPNLQFVFTSHSPLVASTVNRENVFVTRTLESGNADIVQLEEKVFGRSAEELLLSDYFGLLTTRPEEFESQGNQLFERAVKGEKGAALEFLTRLIDVSKTDARETGNKERSDT